MNNWHTLIYLGTKNKNGRVYPLDLDILDLQDKVKHRLLMGELGYPNTEIIHKDSPEDYFSISPSRVSHLVEELKIEDNQLMGRIKILDTPQGKILSEFPSGEIVFRPRSIGSVDENGIVTIEKIISFDAILKNDDAF